MGKLFDKIKAEFGEEKGVVSLDERTPYYANTGHYGLNRIISGLWHGGWAGGTVNELFGDPSTGKSLIIAGTAAAMQKGFVYVPPESKKLINNAESVVCLHDSEHAYNKAFCDVAGLNAEEIINILGDDVDIDTVEAHFEMMEDKVRRIRSITEKAPIGAFLDSIAQLTTKHELKNMLEKPDMQKAKLLHAAMRLYSAFIKNNALMYLVANHVTENIGVMFGPTKKPKGGSGIAFQATVRVNLTYKTRFIRNKMETEEAGDRGDVYGVRSIAVAEKNKNTAPFQYTVLDVYFDKGTGIDPYSGLVDYFVRQGRIVQTKKATGGKNPQPALYEFKSGDVTSSDFALRDFPTLVIEKDILGIKAAGFPYFNPINVGADRSEIPADEDDVPPPPPPLPTRSAKI